MDNFTLFFCYLVAAGALALGIPLKSDTAGEISPQLKLVVTVDGKSFFSDVEERSWHGSSDYCKSLGMKLASINSAAQYKALNNSYSSDFSGNHWTSGRDARALRQFSWNDTDEPLSLEYLDYWQNHSITFLTCVGFYSGSGSPPSFLYSHICTETAATLCET